MDTLDNGFNDNIFLPKIEQDMYPKADKLVIQILKKMLSFESFTNISSGRS